MLFVGSLFGPNLDGVKWYVINVAPYVKYKTLVVDKGFETVKDELFCDNVEIIGTLEDMSEYYNGAKAVVMPILYGDGMKVKTAEGLMYGKTVIGTTEAFEEYSVKNGQEGYCVNTSEEFIDVINNKELVANSTFSRELYEKNYSLTTCTRELKNFFDQLESGV